MNREGTVYNAMGRINRLSVLCIDAYGVAVKNGFKGTVEEWLESLKGADGKDGYTPQKGIDYFDGQDGADGYTPQKGVDYFDGKDGKDGSSGKDGVSATHSWNGTTLTITSASGTSSANLKGDRGDRGERGEKGDTGDDYVLTEADKQEIAEAVAANVAVSLDDGYGNITMALLADPVVTDDGEGNITII